MDYLRRYYNDPVLRQLAFYALLASGTYIILLWSPNILGRHTTTLLEIIIFTLPWFMLWGIYSWQTITDKPHRVEISLIVTIIILGIINTALSDSFSRSLPQMRTFIFAGIVALWAAMFLIADHEHRKAFDWFCCACLVIIVPVEIIWLFLRDPYHDAAFNIFTLHPIPLGTLIILLSPGPIALLASKNLKIKLFGLLVAGASLTLIFLTHKRGTWVAVAAILAIVMLFLARRHKYLLVSIILACALLCTLQGWRLYTRLDPKIPRYASILQRVELYNFAFHIWKTHPIMGIGLRPFTHARYLPDYRQHNQALTDFPQAAAQLQTMDNMLLTGCVELGSLMTLSYLTLVLFIVVRYWYRLWSSPATSPQDWYRLAVLLGFAIHSMTYDSLLFPPVNWLFHVQLGIMAGYWAPQVTPVRPSARAPRDYNG
jgi:hypothetical protein